VCTVVHWVVVRSLPSNAWNKRLHARLRSRTWTLRSWQSSRRSAQPKRSTNARKTALFTNSASALRGVCVRGWTRAHRFCAVSPPFPVWLCVWCLTARTTTTTSQLRDTSALQCTPTLVVRVCMCGAGCAAGTVDRVCVVPASASQRGSHARGAAAGDPAWCPCVRFPRAARRQSLQ